MRSVSAPAQRGHATGVACHSRRGLDTAATGGAMPNCRKLDPPGGAQPVAAPGRRQHLLDLGIGIAVPVEGAAHGGPDHLGGRTARVRRREPDPQPAVGAAAHVADRRPDPPRSAPGSRDRVPRRAARAHARPPRRRCLPGVLIAALTSAARDRCAAGAACRRAGARGARCARRACRARNSWPRPDGAGWRLQDRRPRCADQGAARLGERRRDAGGVHALIDLVGGEELAR